MDTRNTIFGLLTDFGSDFAVASIKGVLLRTFPHAQIIDIDHTIEKFNILNAAFVVDKVYCFFPQNTIFICVIDPGVGSKREVLCVELGDYRFIGPNNGIFHFILKNTNANIYKIADDVFTPASVTFHGRDLFAPVAARLALHDRSFLENIDLQDIVFLDIEENGGIITYIDSFGNIKTNITVDSGFKLGDYVRLTINNKQRRIKFVRTFTEVETGDLLCYKGSNATLEIARNHGSAKNLLQVTIGTKIFFDKNA